MDSGYDFDHRVEFTVVIPPRQILQALLEESGLHILKEIDALKSSDSGIRDVLWRSAIWCGTTSDVGNAGTCWSGVGNRGSSK